MSKINGYEEYKKREFCHDVKCPVQLKLEEARNSEEYEKIHQECKNNCQFSAREFHYWLINHGYEIVKKIN